MAKQKAKIILATNLDYLKKLVAKYGTETTLGKALEMEQAK